MVWHKLPRHGRLLLLGLLAAGLIGLLAFNIQEARTIVVQATPRPTLASAEGASATVVGTLAAPRYTGQNAVAQWELTAAHATQLATQAAGPSPTDPRAGRSGAVELADMTAQWQPHGQPALNLQAPTATFNATTGALSLPQGLTASGTWQGRALQLQATHGHANLSSHTFILGGGVSATLQPR